MLKLLIFSCSEAFSNWWRARTMNLLSIGTIMLAMYVLGSFVFVGTNLRLLSLGWEDQIQCHIFLLDQIDPDQRQHIEEILHATPEVARVEYLSKQKASEKFRLDFESYGDVADSLNENPFPASFHVTMKSELAPEAFESIRAKWGGLPGVEEIFYDQEVYKRLSFIAGLVQISGLFFSGILLFASVFTISNVLKLNFLARREEIDIMKLVGASRGCIRGPFLVEGIIQGVAGSVLGLLLLYATFFVIITFLKHHPESFLHDLGLLFLSGKWMVVLVACGFFSGLIGSVFSLNQFLEEHISYH